ncbi:MAG: hypothetical protein HKN42_01155 [Granulosicoccus sp.]|nr:hypothetical protein [Granulosicoccus sp.]
MKIDVQKSVRRAYLIVVGVIASSLSSCGGGGGLDLSGPVITPIDGQWLSDRGASIRFDESFTANRYFNEKYELDADLFDSAAPCELLSGDGSEWRFTANYDNGNVKFYAGDPADENLCFTGVFKSLISLQTRTLSGDTFDTFTNSRVAVRLDFGRWISADNNLELLFFEPSSVDNDDGSKAVTGCVRANGADVINVSGFMNGYDTLHQRNPAIVPLSSGSTGEPVFQSVTFVDVFTLLLVSPSGDAVLVNRVEDADTPLCESPF